ncbi:hypothetical protein [Pseudoxanthomonas mexicana]|uniref:hypothetical protein n=1 Tax=Pseudoxanthomonas mexicana TaxID=128785 RepID=UPI00398AC605
MALSKTEAGRDEIRDRSRKLAAGMRSILLMVDGRRSEEELSSLAASLHAPADALDQLRALGLIADSAPASAGAHDEQADAQRYNALYTLLTESIRAHLGLKGYFMQLKVERCTRTEELWALLPEVATAMSRAKDHDFATRWLDGIRGAMA